jgi:hypothetical protein
MLSGFLPGLGNWALIRLDDSAAFDKLLELWLRKELDPRVTESLDPLENFRKLPCPSWYTLYRCGLVHSEWSERPCRAAVRTFLGHVPVSPDGSAYCYDARTDEVTSLRHGTQGAPKVNLVLDESSPLFRLLEDLRTVRADLRFREDGIHTVLTIERRGEEGEEGGN